MITEEMIRKKAGNKYLAVLKEELSGGDPFPLHLSGTGIGLKIPYRERMKGIEALKSGMKNSGRCGYTLELAARTTRTEGSQSYLKSVFFSSGEDFYGYLGKSAEVRELKRDVGKILNAVPELGEWAVKSPGRIIRMAGMWDDLIKVLLYFRDRETSGLYLREVPLELPTKFMETNEAFLRELLDHILPEDRINREEKDLSLRYGLKKDRDFRFRIIMDPEDDHFRPFRDLAILPEELALWKPVSPRVLIIENKLSFLRFPDIPGMLKIWGSGKSVVLLRECGWLADKDVLYWGDLDPQGFEILSMVREFLPDCRAVCMDRETFRRYERFALVPAGYVQRDDLLLTEREWETYALLTGREHGRLEQERLPMEYVLSQVEKMVQKR